jgi:hypothetical protein
MGAMAVAQGKLSPDRSIIRHIPALGTGRRGCASCRSGACSKARVALTGRHRTSMTGWLPVDGTPARSPAGFGRGLASRAAGKGTFPSPPCPAKSDPMAISSSGQSPKATACRWRRSFARKCIAKLRPETPALWLTDAQGTELSAGLALSLRDLPVSDNG